MCYSMWYNAPIAMPVAGSLEAEFLRFQVTGYRQSWVHYISSCSTQSSAPEDGQNNCPKHVELIGIIDKPLLLHPVAFIYY